MERLLYEKLSNERNPKYNIITDIVERDGKRVVIKRPYSERPRAIYIEFLTATEACSRYCKALIFA